MEMFNKGPWVHAGNTVIHERSRFGICKVIGDDDVDIANAVLIAAAPEMYEMLKRFADNNVVFPLDMRNDMHALLAKARGEQ